MKYEICGNMGIGCISSKSWDIRILINGKTIGS